MELRDPTLLNSSKTLDHFHRQHNHLPLNHLHQLQQQEEIQEPPRDPEANLDSKSPSPSPISHALTICPSPPSVRYRECQKNHAARVGGHVLDGCGEFMPGGEEGSPVFFKCAACNCHRSFHRKESIGVDHFRLPNSAQSGGYAQNQHHNHRQYWRVPSASPQPRTVMMGFGGGAPGGAESSSEDQDLMFPTSHGTGDQLLRSSAQKKRFRTKFSKEQKDEMMEFAEKIGWRIQKEDEQELQQFCAKVGVKRQVFKVWMHNNKQALKKHQQQQQQQEEEQ